MLATAACRLRPVSEDRRAFAKGQAPRGFRVPIALSKIAGTITAVWFGPTMRIERYMDRDIRELGRAQLHAERRHNEGDPDWLLLLTA